MRNVWLDDEKDRRYDDELVERTVKVLYENGWFSGKVKYFKEKICRYCVFYRDEPIHLMDISDIDGFQIILT